MQLVYTHSQATALLYSSFTSFVNLLGFYLVHFFRDVDHTFLFRKIDDQDGFSCRLKTLDGHEYKTKAPGFG